MKIQKGDVVQMLSGKDRGKQGRVLAARPSEGSVVVENLNIDQAAHEAAADAGPEPDGRRRRSMPGGVIERPAPLSVSNVMLVCPVCNRPTRVGMTSRRSRASSVQRRVCKRADCGQEIDR